MTLVLVLLATLTGTPLPEISLPPRAGVLRFAVAGDTGDGAEAVARGIAKVHGEKPLAAILLTGDNFYPCGVTSENDPRWSINRPLTRIGIPVFPVLGNHDFCGKADPEAQIRATGIVPNWRFPARQYAVRGGVADFAFTDTTAYVWGKGKAPEDAIRQTFAASRAPWRVVVGHHPVISSGWHGYFPRDEVARMRNLIPLLRETKVDLYICGHDHHLELIRGRMLLLVSGAASDPIPALKLRARTVYPAEIRREPIGFAVVEITEKEIRVRMYDGEGKARSEWLPYRR